MQRIIPICVALAVSAGCTTFVGAGSELGGIPPRAVDAPYPNWEHMCVRSTGFGGMGGFLTAAGDQGWELVAITPDSMYCFKRPVAPPGGFQPPPAGPGAGPSVWRETPPAPPPPPPPPPPPQDAPPVPPPGDAPPPPPPPPPPNAPPAPPPGDAPPAG